MLFSEFAKFKDASQKGNLVPLFRRIFSDQLTPVLAYRCLVKEDDYGAPSFLFESVENNETGNNVGRYSMVGARPAIEIVAKGELVTILNHEKGSRTERLMEDPMRLPSEIASKWKSAAIEGLPNVFCGGWVGFFSYDTVRYVEKKKLPIEKAPLDDRSLPDIHLGLYKDVVIFDHVSKMVYILHWVCNDHFSSLEEAYFNGQTQLNTLVAQLQSSDKPRLNPGSVEVSIGKYGSAINQSNMTKDEYIAAFYKAKDHILAGDIFQIVLSQRFERRTYADPYDVYRALRVVNPSPYMIYLQAKDCILVASSPETLTCINKGKIINRPLAGTRPRGQNQEEDLRLEDELLRDEKECAEHVMLVDLGRNDVGKVSKAGSVKVERFMDVERYSHVMHISSTVSGEIRDGLTSWDVLKAALPAGTVSGAPKVRAMELIDQLEKTRRGPYSGGIGGISFTGDLDIALTLRTMVFPTSSRHNSKYSHGKLSNRREWVVHLQAGSGIVADSNPEDEYKECITKAAGLVPHGSMKACQIGDLLSNLGIRGLRASKRKCRFVK
ncbi:hypothetical protein GOP47_0023567 [Adiantum capillus-veneris]|uniref:anthranilate synthase n=1 Tax=Adiantum capillus-veneris TaxID=13818 RepID=A0A9D4U4S6_ADICA|nr:hypothetical protein GOP47_0023567 [Adiantum capillus-veneris]